VPASSERQKPQVNGGVGLRFAGASTLRGRIKLHNASCGPVDVVVKIGFGHPQQTIDGNGEFDLSHKLPPVGKR
jgi:hypothetical protein